MVKTYQKEIMKQQYDKTYNLPFRFKDLLKLIKSLSVEDKVIIEKEIEQETILYRSKKLSDRIKENQLDMDNIVAEVSTYRKEKR